VDTENFTHVDRNRNFWNNTGTISMLQLESSLAGPRVNFASA
jgi:hypothetical protein